MIRKPTLRLRSPALFGRRLREAAGHLIGMMGSAPAGGGDELSAIFRRLAQAGSGLLLIRVMNIALLFVAHLVLTRALGTHEYGVFLIGLSVLGVAQTFARHGFDATAARFIASYSVSGNHALLRGYMRASTLAPLAGSLAIGAMFLLGMGWIAPFLSLPAIALVLVAAILPFATLSQIDAAIARAFGRAVLSDLFLSLFPPLALAAGTAIAVILPGAAPTATVALACLLAGMAVTLALERGLLIRTVPAEVRASQPQFRWAEWCKPAVAMTLFLSGSVLLIQINTLLLGTLSTPADAALYGIATKVGGLLQLVTVCFIASASPVIGRLAAAKRHSELQSLVTVSTRVVLALSALGAGVLAVAGHWLLGLFGAEFAAAYACLIVLALGYLPVAATICAGIVLNMAGHHGRTGRILVVSALVDLIACAALVPGFGAMGAAIATAASAALCSILMAAAAWRETGIRGFIALGRNRAGRAAEGRTAAAG